MWLVVADFLVSDPLFLRSGHGQVNDVPVNLYQTKVILCLTRKGKVPRHNFHPPRSQFLVKRTQISIGSYFRASSHTLPSCHPWGSQASNPTGPQSPQAAQMGETRSHRLWPGRQPLLLGRRDRYEGEVPRGLRAWTKANGGHQWGLWSPIIPSLFPGPSSSPAGTRLALLLVLEDPQEKS